MSKSSTKQKYAQLKEWLKTFRPEATKPTTGKPRKFSKADTYNKSKRYAKKSN